MGGTPSQPAASRRLPEAVLASRYQQRMKRLLQEVASKPCDEPLERTLRRCIAFCYEVSEAAS